MANVKKMEQFFSVDLFSFHTCKHWEPEYLWDREGRVLARASLKWLVIRNWAAESLVSFFLWEKPNKTSDPRLDLSNLVHS